MRAPIPANFAKLGQLLPIEAADGSRALLCLHGGQVLSWTGRGGDERLFVSSRAVSRGPGGEPLAIRGGVPICFPQFAALGPLAKHGYARLATWQELPGLGAGLQVAAGQWPGVSASLQLRILVRPSEDRLELELDVKIGPEAPLEFTAALHTYLAVDDVTKVELRGAEGLVTREAGRPDGRQSGPLRFGSEVDRQLLGLQRALDLHGPQGQLLLRFEQSGFPDAVVWNIGPEKAANLSDLGPNEWRRYLCVEAALTAAPLLLQPGSTWRGQQRLVML